MFQVYGNQYHGLSSAEVGLGQQIFFTYNSRQPGMKSYPLAAYKKDYVCYKCLPGTMEQIPGLEVFWGKEQLKT